MRAEDHRGTVRDFVQLVHENGAFGPEIVDHVHVVNDLFSNVDGARIQIQGQIDDIYGSIHSGAEASRLRQEQLLDRHGYPLKAKASR
jgi:hypothetical protein